MLTIILFPIILFMFKPKLINLDRMVIMSIMCLRMDNGNFLIMAAI